MIQWVSLSLFRRMVGILLLGLVLAQILDRAIHLYQHHQITEKYRQTESARRIADRIRLLSALKPETQQAVIEQLHDADIQLAKNPKKHHWTGESNDPKFKLFRSTLNTLLRHQPPIGITLTETIPNSLVLYVYLKNHNTLILKTNLIPSAEEDPSVWLHLVIIIVALMGFSLVAVHWVTRPLQQLANAAEELGNDIHRPPLDENGPIEVSRAAHAFNTMQSRLIRHIQDRTQLLAAISHDLKTPITRLRLRTELLDDNHTRERFQKDLNEMESMVMATLDFMRGVDQQEAFQPVDMMALLESLQADAAEMQEQVTIQGTLQSPYIGKPTALKRCISNLLDNAFKYGRTAMLLVDDSEKWLTIRILDQGSGIPKDQMEKVFAPYYRLETSRNRDTGGTGLGLSIAQDIAHAHGGHLSLDNIPAGGLEAILTLPRSAVLVK